MPPLPAATDHDVLRFIELHRLMGRGIGYIGAYLLTAAAIRRAKLWTRDKRLNSIAEALDLAYTQ